MNPAELAPLALCTICDWRYLARMLVLVRSLRRVAPDLPLHVVCLDELTRKYLEHSSGVVTIPVREIERSDPELLAIREGRTQQRYAWTLKPASCLHLLGNRRIAESILFLDADLMFFSPLDPIFDELAQASVVLVPERHVAPDAWTPAGLRPELGGAAGETWGFYNSGMVGFRRDRSGLAAVKWWREQCVASARNWRAAAGQGDQWHLNAMPERFSGVRIMDHPGVGLAPWNARSVKLTRCSGHLLADGRPVVDYHYQSLRLSRDDARSRLTGWRVNDLGRLPGLAPPLRVTISRHWRLSASERELLWNPYQQELALAVEEILTEHHGWAEQLGSIAPVEIAGDIVGELSWRGYRTAGSILPARARRVASSLRGRSRQRLTTRT